MQVSQNLFGYGMLAQNSPTLSPRRGDGGDWEYIRLSTVGVTLAPRLS